MSHADIALVYEGSVVESGVMDVRDLAPALLAFGNLVEATNRVVNGESATVKVQVKTVGAGSFAIGLDVGVEFTKAVRDFLVGPRVDCGREPCHDSHRRRFDRGRRMVALIRRCADASRC